jgi:hypothetical protein
MTAVQNLPLELPEFCGLAEDELLARFERLVVADRRTTAHLLAAIAEIDKRKLWARRACSSMFEFCLRYYNMSEQVAAKRIWTARTTRRFPVMLAMLARGELHLTAIQLLSKHLTEANHAGVLERAKHRTSREIENLIAEIAPRPDVPSRIRALPRRTVTVEAGVSNVEGGRGPERLDRSMFDTPGRDRPDGTTGEPEQARRPVPTFAASEPARSAKKQIIPLAPHRYKVEITVDQETHDKLRRLQDLLSQQRAGLDPAAVVSRALDVLLEKTLKRKAALTERPRSGARTAKQNSSARDQQPARQRTPHQARHERPHGTGESQSIGNQGDEGRRRMSRRGGTTPRADAASTDANQSARRPRTIPAAVRREVWLRDGGRCVFVDDFGERCRATRFVEFHHRNPFAKSGAHEVANVELRCRAHNQAQADLDFGADFMHARRGRRTFRAECSGAPDVPTDSRSLPSRRRLLS